MRHTSIAYASFIAALAFAAGVATAQPNGQHPGKPAGGHPPSPPHAAVSRAPGPTHYQAVTPPQGWNARPNTINRGAYQHNFQAQRSFRIGPYHPPSAGWQAQRWVFGQILPRIYWATQYVIGDYWLFGLETPPVGCEWVRYGADALLINMATGEVLQADYGVFA